jgi:hypothetical protein
VVIELLRKRGFIEMNDINFRIGNNPTVPIPDLEEVFGLPARLPVDVEDCWNLGRLESNESRKDGKFPDHEAYFRRQFRKECEPWTLDFCHLCHGDLVFSQLDVCFSLGGGGNHGLGLGLWYDALRGRQQRAFFISGHDVVLKSSAICCFSFSRIKTYNEMSKDLAKALLECQEYGRGVEVGHRILEVVRFAVVTGLKEVKPRFVSGVRLLVVIAWSGER